MQGEAVLIPAPFPACDGVLSCFPRATGSCPVSRVCVPFPARNGVLSCSPVFVARFPRAAGLVLFPAYNGFLSRFPRLGPVSRMQRGPVLFPRVQHGVPARSWCCRAFPRCLPNQVRSFSLVTFFSLRKESNKEVGRPMTFSRLPSMDSMMSSGCSWMA